MKSQMDIAVLLICLQVTLGRMLDVPLQTLRLIFIVRGKSRLGAAAGFLETFIWFVIVREAIVADVNKFFLATAYALGFALGTLIGGAISKRFIRSNIDVQVVTSNRDDDLVQQIRDQGYGVSVVDVHESEFSSEKYMLFIEIQENQLRDLKKLIKSLDSSAFMMVRETKYVQNGYFVKK